MFNVSYKRKAARYLARLSRNIRERILTEITVLSETGEHKSAISLTNTEGYRLRVGDYRILYTKDDIELTILVVKIGPRGEIYHD